MKQTRILMGMPITIEIVDNSSSAEDIEDIYEYFTYIDNTFSTYKEESEMTRINKGIITSSSYSNDMKKILELSEQTKQQTSGYFNIYRKDKTLEPAGIVKGWAIFEASKILKEKGFKNFYIEAGGDIQVSGKNLLDKTWSVGIKNPFNRNEIVKTLYVSFEGIATSGTYIRGQHIYDPFNIDNPVDDIISLTVIGPNIYEADRFATAVFAMGKKGIQFINNLEGFEGYMIDNKGIATYTNNFSKYSINPEG